MTSSVVIFNNSDRGVWATIYGGEKGKQFGWVKQCEISQWQDDYSTKKNIDILGEVKNDILYQDTPNLFEVVIAIDGAYTGRTSFDRSYPLGETLFKRFTNSLKMYRPIISNPYIIASIQRTKYDPNKFYWALFNVGYIDKIDRILDDY